MTLEHILRETTFILAYLAPILGWALVFQTAGKVRVGTAILSLLLSALVLFAVVVRFVPISGEIVAKTIGIPEKDSSVSEIQDQPSPAVKPPANPPSQDSKNAGVLPNPEPPKERGPGAVLVKPQKNPENNPVIGENPSIPGLNTHTIPPTAGDPGPRNEAAEPTHPAEPETGNTAGVANSPEEKARWMKKAAALLKQQKNTPVDEATKNLVATGFDCLSTTFVMQGSVPAGEANTGEREFLLRWKKPFDGADCSAQIHLSNIITREVLENCRMIPDKDWKNINLIILGKKTSGGPLEVMIVNKIEKITGNAPTYKTLFQNKQLPDPGGLTSMAELPCYAGIDALAKKHLGADLTKTNLPITPGQPILLDAALNTQAPTRDAQVENLKKRISALRSEILETWGYIPPITINYRQKETPVIILSLGRTNTGSSVEKDMHLIDAHPLIKRIWEQKNNTENQ